MGFNAAELKNTNPVVKAFFIVLGKGRNGPDLQTNDEGEWSKEESDIVKEEP